MTWCLSRIAWRTREYVSATFAVLLGNYCGLCHTQSMQTRSSKPKDVNQLAAEIVEAIANGQGGKNPFAVALGRLGGAKGGRARAERLSPRRRKEIARKAAKALWTKRRAQKS